MQTVTGLAPVSMCPRLDEASRRIGQRRDATRAPNWGRSSRFRGSREGALSLLVEFKDLFIRELQGEALDGAVVLTLRLPPQDRGLKPLNAKTS